MSLALQFKTWRRTATHSKHVLGTCFDYHNVSFLKGMYLFWSLPRCTLQMVAHCLGCSSCHPHLSHKGFGCGVRGSSAQKAKSQTQHGIQCTDQAGRGGRSVRRLTEKRPGPISAGHPGVSPISSFAKNGNQVCLLL